MMFVSKQEYFRLMCFIYVITFNDFIPLYLYLVRLKNSQALK